MQTHVFFSGALLVALQLWTSGRGHAVDIRETLYQGRPHYLVTTTSCVWYFDRGGGGFSRLIDSDGRDWIAFNKEPLAEFPASAAAGYRGIPNAVFVGPDKGAGHPGFDRCESVAVEDNVIRSVSKSGKWTWSWTFSERMATFRMEQAPDDAVWWFLYEGPIAGTFAPQQKLWGTDSTGLSRACPSNKSQFFGNWQTLYVADQRLPRILVIHQHQADDLPDNFWYLGSSDGGGIESDDGMVVAGFGRDRGTKPRLTGSGHEFTVAFIEMDSTEQLKHQAVMQRVSALLSAVAESEDQASEPSPDVEPKVSVWYGDRQLFGNLGFPQRWINVLGNISPREKVQRATFRVDAGPEQPLSLGTDLHRLGATGDFNVELPVDKLAPGEHLLVITAYWTDGSLSTNSVTLQIHTPKTDWPLPFEVDFTDPRFVRGGWPEVQRVAQIIDGHWEIRREGLRTKKPWYDRVVGFGDRSWTDYEATVKLTIHGFTPPQPGPPTYDVSHCALALRWFGHTADGRQPSRQWYPMGCQGELLLREDLTECQWRALPGIATIDSDGVSQERSSTPVYSETPTRIRLGVPIFFKARVEGLSNGETRYAFKHWHADRGETDDWSVQQQEPDQTDNLFGSLIVVPHNSDVTIHQVRVIGLSRS